MARESNYPGLCRRRHLLLKPDPAGTQRALCGLAAWGCLLLGLAGTILPGLPTTPFILASLWLGHRADSKIVHYLLKHPRFSLIIDNWQHHRQVPLQAKILALAMFIFNLLLLVYLKAPPALIISVGSLFVVLAVFILRLKSS